MDCGGVFFGTGGPDAVQRDQRSLGYGFGWEQLVEIGFAWVCCDVALGQCITASSD